MEHITFFGKPVFLQLVKYIPGFCGTWGLSTVFARTYQFALDWVWVTQSITSQPLSWTLMLIWFSHLCLHLPYRLFTLCFPTKSHVHFSPPPPYATFPTHFILHDLTTKIIFYEECISWSSSLCNLLHSPFPYSYLGPNIFLSKPFSNFLSPCFSS